MSLRPSYRSSVARRGMTMAELLIASAIMAMMVTTLAGLATATRESWAHSEGQALAAQHARVALQRIAQTVRGAKATGIYHGAVVISTSSGGQQYRETLVVWKPSGAPTNANGPPLVKECVIYCPNPSNLRQLLEITAPSDNRTIPLNDGLSAAWIAEIELLKTSGSTTKTVITDLLRVGTSGTRAAVNFSGQTIPSVAQWNNYVAGSVTWNAMTWPQNLRGHYRGTRQVWVRCEIQLMPGENAYVTDPAGETAVPFFGSAAIQYSMKKS